jgi:hypothetical protein
MGLAFKKSFRIDGSHTACAGGGNRLAINVILDIAASKHSRHIGFGAVVRHDVTRGI